MKSKNFIGDMRFVSSIKKMNGEYVVVTYDTILKKYV